MDNEFRKRLTRAFIFLRRNGYFASHNFACCRSCSWDEIEWEEADHAVFYHDQDEASAAETGDVYLVWQGDAELIREALEVEGLIVEHDGTEATRILVKMPLFEI